MARNYAVLPHEYQSEMDCLTDAEFGRLCRALIQYSADGTPIALSGNERFFSKRVMMQEDRFKSSYEATVDAKREAGKKGMAKRWNANGGNSVISVITGDNKNNQTETKTETKTETQVTIVTGGKRNAQARFLPPSVDDVAAYCRERQNGIDAQVFVDFYASKGWKVGSSPMKDWKAAVRTWEQRKDRRSGNVFMEIARDEGLL